MKRLKRCLGKVNKLISRSDADLLKKEAAEYESEGKSSGEAELMAVRDAMGDIQDSYDSLHEATQAEAPDAISALEAYWNGDSLVATLPKSHEDLAVAFAEAGLTNKAEISEYLGDKRSAWADSIARFIEEMPPMEKKAVAEPQSVLQKYLTAQKSAAILDGPEKRKRRKKPDYVGDAALGAAATGAGLIGAGTLVMDPITHGIGKKFQSVYDSWTKTNKFPDTPALVDVGERQLQDYIGLGSELMYKGRVLGVPAPGFMKLVRKSPLSPKQWRGFDEPTRLHYESFANGPMSAYLRYMQEHTDASLDSRNQEFQRFVTNAVGAPLDPRKALELAKTDPRSFTDKPLTEDPVGFVAKLNSHATDFLKSLHPEAKSIPLSSFSNQQDAYAGLNDYIGKTDPEFLKEKRTIDASIGLSKVPSAGFEYAQNVIEPVKKIRNNLYLAGAGLLAAGGGYLLLNNWMKKRKEEEREKRLEQKLQQQSPIRKTAAAPSFYSKWLSETI